MSYVYSYNTAFDKKFHDPAKKGVNPRQRINLKHMIICVVFGMTILVGMIPTMRKAVIEFLLPGDRAVNQQAREDLIQTLKEGESFKEAFTDFCIEIIKNA